MSTQENSFIDKSNILDLVKSYAEAVPGLDAEKLGQKTLGLLNGELNLKEEHGLTDEAMESVYTIAYNEFMANRYEKAHPLFTFLCMFDNKNKKYWNALGACRFRKKDYVDAAAAYGVAGMMDEDDPLPALCAVDCYLACQELDTAIEALHYAVRICRKDTTRYEKELERALSTLDVLVRHGKKNSRDR